ISPPKKRPKRSPKPPDSPGIVELQALPRVGEFIVWAGPQSTEAYRVIAVCHHVGYRPKLVGDSVVWSGRPPEHANDVFVVRAGTEGQIRE
ncbi:hypothetical protein ACXYUI_28425, partial [Klebsiella pneumoniae]